MKFAELAGKIETMCGMEASATLADSLTKLQNSAQELSALPQDLLEITCQELINILEKLQVNQQEMRQQHQTLDLAYQAIAVQCQRYQDLLEFTQDGYLITNPQGIIWEANQAAATLLNISPKSLAGQPLVNFLPLPEQQKFLDQLDRRHYPGQFREWELHLQPANRLAFDAVLTVATINDLQGNPVALRWLVRDISKRKRAIEILVDRERIAALDTDINIALNQSDNLSAALQQCSAALVRHLDLALVRIWTLNEANNILELQASDGIYTHIDGVHSRIPVGSLKIGQIVQECQPHITNNLWDDPDADGEWVRREGMVAFAGYPLIVEERVRGVIAIFARQPLNADTLNKVASIADAIAQYIERKQAEAALRESEERLRQITENIKEVFWLFDLRQNKICYVSPAYEWIWGRTCESLYQQPQSFLDAIHLEDRERYLTAHAQLLQGKSFEEEYRILWPDGLVRWICDRGFPIQDESGEVCRICGVAQDITERKQVEAALAKSEAKNRAILNAIPDLMFRLRGDGTYLSYKMPKNQEMLLSHPELLGKKLSEVLPTEVAELSMHYIRRALANDEVQTFEYQIPLDGHIQDYEARLVVIGEDEVLGIIRDITERKQADAKIHYQAFHDLLTGLPNRTYFNEQLLLALADAEQKQKMLAVIFLDLDRFKNINDTLGHTVGDRLLQKVAERLLTCLRSGEILARWGGDEFTLILPQISDPQDAAEIAQRICYEMKPVFRLEDQEFHISSSLGISIYPQNGEDPQTLLRNADAALYRAKEQGRNHYQFYIPAMNSQASALLMLNNRLHQALEREEFLVHYQPQVNIQTGKVAGMEALVRWQHPEIGLISPAQFIPLAEENGLIILIGEWVLRTACAQNKAWQDAGFPQMRIAVNLSARQFQQPQLVEMVTKILQETKLSPEFLELEITETTFMQNVESARAMLNELQAMGVHISMDDFGTGYSSLSYLKKFPFDKLKIDQSFVRDLKPDSQDTAILSAIVSLGQGLNLRIVAEGVETSEQQQLLKGLDCREMQGYLFSRPLGAEDATNFLQNYGENVGE